MRGPFVRVMGREVARPLMYRRGGRISASRVPSAGIRQSTNAVLGFRSWSERSRTLKEVDPALARRPWFERRPRAPPPRPKRVEKQRTLVPLGAEPVSLVQQTGLPPAGQGRPTSPARYERAPKDHP